MLSHSVMSDSWWLHGLWPTRLLYSWTFPWIPTGMGCCFLPRVSFRPRIESTSLAPPAMAGRFFPTLPPRKHIYTPLIETHVSVNIYVCLHKFSLDLSFGVWSFNQISSADDVLLTLTCRMTLCYLFPFTIMSYFWSLPLTSSCVNFFNVYPSVCMNSWKMYIDAHTVWTVIQYIVLEACYFFWFSSVIFKSHPCCSMDSRFVFFPPICCSELLNHWSVCLSLC